MTLRRGHGFSVRQTTPLLYLAAFVLCLGGWVGAALIAAGDWDGLETVEIHTLTTGNAVPVTENGIAIFTNIEQDRKVTCRSEQKGSVSLSDPGFDFTTERGSGEWHLLAVSKEAKPGNYAIGCTPGNRMSDSALYGYADLPDFRGAAIGNGVGSIATLAAVILTIWTFVRRRRFAKGLM